jgi:hypothetical protein
MRTLTATELNQANGGFALNQAYIVDNVVKPMASGAIAGAVIGYMFGQTNIGKYALAYGVASAASTLGMSFVNQVI